MTTHYHYHIQLIIAASSPSHSANATATPTSANPAYTNCGGICTSPAPLPPCDCETPVCCALPGSPGLYVPLELALALPAAADAELPVADALFVPLMAVIEAVPLSVVTPVTEPEVNVLVSEPPCGTGRRIPEEVDIKVALIADVEASAKVDGVWVCIAVAEAAKTSAGEESGGLHDRGRKGGRVRVASSECHEESVSEERSSAYSRKPTDLAFAGVIAQASSSILACRSCGRQRHDLPENS